MFMFVVEKRSHIPHMKKEHRRGFLYAFNITAFILIVLFAITTTLLHAFETLTQNVNMHIEGAGASSLLVPTTFSVAITNASTTPLNAVEFELHFDPKAVHLTSINPLPTLCEDRFIITNSINNASGTALFQCGTVTPFRGSAGVIATINAIPLRTGTSSMRFGTTTHVLAHDGLGSDVTGIKTGYIVSTI